MTKFPDVAKIEFGRPKGEKQRHRANGIAAPGSWDSWDWQNYARSYCAAAEVMWAHLDANRTDLEKLGLPLFYLQRHAAELLIKELLGDVYALSRDSIPKKTMDRLNRSHGLSALLADLKEWLPRVLGDAPGRIGKLASLLELVNALEAVEKGDECVSRYENGRKSTPTSGDRKEQEKSPWRPSFPDMVEIPLESIQGKLRKALFDVLGDDDGQDDMSIARELHYLGMAREAAAEFDHQDDLDDES